jgi:thymidylate kinase
LRCLRFFLPRPDRTFVIVAPTWLLQKRQPGQPVEELERQQKILHQLAEDTRRYATISAEESPEELARDVWREVVKGMATREAHRA